MMDMQAPAIPITILPAMTPGVQTRAHIVRQAMHAVVVSDMNVG